MRTGSLAALAALSLVAAIPPAHAASLQVPVGARGIAMGGAFSAISDDATASYWNPAGLPWVGNQEISATHADLFGSGIKTDFAAFVLPLSRAQAVAVDFFHSGFGDAELDYGETRIDLATGRKITSSVSLGATLKYLSRHTDLDGFSVRSGSGVGADLGVLVTPTSWLRLAGVAQDVFDTRIHYSEGEGSVVAFPRTIRLGAAFAPLPRGLVAVDVDDFLHLGAEYAPIAPIALRAGYQRDLEGLDDDTFSFGMGLRWSGFRFDYALVDHPVLGATSHFGLGVGFNFNPSQVRIEKVTATDVYTSLYKTYASSGFGTVRLRNLEDGPITARVGVLIPDLMPQPSEQEVVLRPRATVDVPLTAVLPDRVLDRPGDRPIQVQVTASYQSLRLPRVEKAAARCIAYGPGAIDWSQGVAQAAAFVTTRDPVIESVARDAVRVTAADSGSSGNRNIDFAAALFDAVESLGVSYVPDPTNPYAAISGEAKAVDTIFYPRETLAKRAGDCDDTTVLLAALLGNVGIRTQFVDVPGHILLLAGTDVHSRNQLALGFDDERFVIENDEVWIPIETTALGKGFAEAWRIGAESYAGWAARGRVRLVDVGAAQSRYESGELAPAASTPTLDAPRLRASYGRDLRDLATLRADHFERRYGDLDETRDESPEALDEIARVYFMAGQYDASAGALTRAHAADSASARALNNLGVLDAARGDLGSAEERFRAAAAIETGDAGIWLNLGLARYALGDSAGAEEPVDRALAAAGGYEQACALLGLAPETPPGREGTARVTEDEARAMLKASLARVPRAPAAPPAAAPEKQKRRPWVGRVAGGRSAESAELAELLYWKLR